MACRISELVIDAADPDRLADFWSKVLGYVGRCQRPSLRLSSALFIDERPRMALRLKAMAGSIGQVWQPHFIIGITRLVATVGGILAK
jgi:hypothetical protein